MRWCTFLVTALTVVLRSATPSPGGLVADELPLIQSWVPAAAPADLAPAARVGRATIRITVNESGAMTAARVLRATHPQLGEAALSAVKQWTFRPGISGGKPAVFCLDVPIEFNAKPTKPGLSPPLYLLPQLAPRTPASLRLSPHGDYPRSLRGRGLNGMVKVVYAVAPNGYLAEIPRIIGASHADFVLPALEGWASWQFEPARQGDLPIGADLRAEIEFDGGVADGAAVLKANAIALDGGDPPAVPPRPRIVADPIWPYDLLIRGEGGAAVVTFTVPRSGVPTDIVVREATDPDFGRAAAAAVEGSVLSRRARRMAGRRQSSCNALNSSRSVRR